MDFVITPRLTEKVFTKIGSIAGDALDLSTPQQQESFTSGLIDYLQKEANLDPFMTLGFLHFVAQRGAEYYSTNDKTATTDFLQIEDEFFKNAGFWDDTVNPAIGWVGDKIVKPLAQPVVDNSVRKNMQEQIGNTIGNVGGQIGEFGNKAMEYLKSPGFLQGVAPWVVGGIGGYLLPKLLSGNKSSTATNLAGAAGGLALGGAVGNQLNGGQTMNQAQNFLDNLRKQNAQTFRR